MRNTFLELLTKEAEKDESIILMVGDLGFNVIEPFQSKFPSRFINAGICEQNMATMAAGLASEGFKVFIYSIANFPTFRCAEQIRNDICYHNLDVTIVVVGGGLAYGNLGYSHHAIQDYGLMRLFPEMTILSPGDPHETSLLFEFIKNESSPKYLRLRKSGESVFNKNEKLQFPGYWNKITNGNSREILLTTGHGLFIANKMILNSEYKNFGIYTCPIWGSKYSKIQSKQAKNFDKIITVEDHLYSCGFGSWINESLYNSDCSTKINSISIKEDMIGKVGNEEFFINKLWE